MIRELLACGRRIRMLGRVFHTWADRSWSCLSAFRISETLYGHIQSQHTAALEDLESV